jgi:flagellin
MIGSIGSSAGSSWSSNFTQSVSLIHAKWTNTLALASLGGLAQEFSGVSPYQLNPAAASMMDSLQSDLAVQSQGLVNAGYAQAKEQMVDSALGQVNGLLTTVQTDILSMADGTMTAEQKAAKQMEIQSALQSIDRIGNTTTFAGQKLLDGSKIIYNSTTSPSTQIEYAPPKVNAGSLGNDTGKLSDLSTLLDAGDYDAAMQIAKDAQSTIRNGRAAGGNFYNAVQVQSNMISDQMVNTAALYNQAASIVYGSSPRQKSPFSSMVMNMNNMNARYGVLQSLLAGINR